MQNYVFYAFHKWAIPLIEISEMYFKKIYKR